jgi:hypothetical protein
MILTQRLAMTPMSCDVMRAIMAADWRQADGLLGTPFPSNGTTTGGNGLHHESSKAITTPVCWTGARV